MPCDTRNSFHEGSKQIASIIPCHAAMLQRLRLLKNCSSLKGKEYNHSRKPQQNQRH